MFLRLKAGMDHDGKASDYKVIITPREVLNRGNFQLFLGCNFTVLLSSFSVRVMAEPVGPSQGSHCHRQRRQIVYEVGINCGSYAN